MGRHRQQRPVAPMILRAGEQVGDGEIPRHAGQIEHDVEKTDVGQTGSAGVTRLLRRKPRPARVAREVIDVRIKLSAKRTHKALESP